MSKPNSEREASERELGARLRKDFDLLRNREGLIYLDTAATSQKPNQVLQAMHDYYHHSCANIHKGVEHILSGEATEHYESARRKVASFINAGRPEEVVFTRNATEGLNMVAHGWGMHNLKEGDEILMSVAEHHSSLAPWQLVAGKTGARIVDVNLTKDTEEIDLTDFESKLSSRTKVVVMVHLSNVLGSVLPAERVCEAAHKVGALVLLDSCQFLPHRKTDVQAFGCDWLVASGHKMLAPTSSGFLWGRYEILSEMEPLLVGGSTTGEIHFGKHTDVKPPLRFEAGTPAIAEAIGLGAAVDYLSAIGMDKVHEYETELAKLMHALLSDVPGIRIFGPPPAVPQGRASLVSFQVKGFDAMQLASDLDKRGICISAGFHRAKPLHEDYFKTGPTMRASAYIYNTEAEVRAFVAALRERIEAQQQGRTCVGQ